MIIFQLVSHYDSLGHAEDDLRASGSASQAKFRKVPPVPRMLSAAASWFIDILCGFKKSFVHHGIVFLGVHAIDNILRNTFQFTVVLIVNCAGVSE